MKLTKFIRRLHVGSLTGVFPHENAQEVVKFISGVIDANKGGNFLLQIQLSCRCSRFVHYQVKEAGLVTLPSKGLAHQFALVPEIAWPKRAVPCSKIPIIPERWRNFPIIGLTVGYTHGVFDHALDDRWGKTQHSARNN